MIKNKIIWGIVILIVVFGGLYIINNKKPSVDGPVKIGAVLPMSGDLAVIGETALTAINIATDEINAEGGISGNNLEFIIEDSACDSGEAVKVTQKLISVDKLKIITGLICSGEALSIIPVIEQADVFGFSLAATSPDLSGISRNFARIFASDAGQAETLANYANENFEKVGILYESSDYSIANRTSFEKNFNGDTFSEKFVTDTRDVKTQITKILSNDVDAMFIIVQSPVTAEVVLSQSSNLGLNVPILADVLTISSPGIAKKYSKLLEGAISAQVILDETDGVEKFRNEFKERTGSEDVPFEVYAVAVYDGIHLLADGIRKEGYDANKVAEFVYKTNDRPGLSGYININDDGDRVGAYKLLRLESGKLVPIK